MTEQPNCGVHLTTRKPTSGSTRIPKSDVQCHYVEEQESFRAAVLCTLRDKQEISIVHDHGLWLESNRAVAQAALKQKITRVVSPRGMMSPWAMSSGKFKKRLAWLIYQRRHLACADAFHATSELEADEIRSFGFTQPIAILPNGVTRCHFDAKQNPSGDPKVALFLSRIHEKKGLENFIEAWQIAAMGTAWVLKIVGPSEPSYLEKLKKLVVAKNLETRISFHPEVDDREKWSCFQNADLFVLPSFSENFGIVVAEAMSAGVPILTTTGTPWLDLQKRDAGWCVDPTIHDFTKTLNLIKNLSTERLQQMGHRASVWSQEEFDWNEIGNRMHQFYQWLGSQDSQPSFVT